MFKKIKFERIKSLSICCCSGCPRERWQSRCHWSWRTSGWPRTGWRKRTNRKPRTTGIKWLNTRSGGGISQTTMQFQWKCLRKNNLKMDETFLAHLSRRIKWAFLIKICPLSVVVVVVLVVGVVDVNYSHFLSHLQKHWANYNQTWHKASLGDEDSSLLKWGPCPFPRGNDFEIVKIHWRNIKIFSRTTGAISTKFDTKHLWVKVIQNYSNEEPFEFYSH